MIKQLLKSRTVHLALIQAVGGVAIAVLTELEMVAYVSVIKSFIDILLRLDTTQPISEK